MKILIVSVLVIVGCILTTGCVGQIKNPPVAEKTVTPTYTFTPFSNATITPGTTSPTPSETPDTTGISNTTGVSNITDTTVTPGLKGSLRISAGGWVGEFPVFIDKVRAGTVTTEKPISLMIDEGNHTVEVCCGAICQKEDVFIKFGEQRNLDFSEQLKEGCEFSEPTVRITGYYLSGHQITVNVEFINPTLQTLTMTADISVGYSYIESQSNSRVGNSAGGQVYSTLKPGDRVTKVLDLALDSGYSYNYEIPTITQVTKR